MFLTAIDSREVFQRLANNEVLQLIAGAHPGRRRAPTLGELIAALSADPQIEATPEEAEAYLDKLIEIGFLRFHTGIREQDSRLGHPLPRAARRHRRRPRAPGLGAAGAAARGGGGLHRRRGGRAGAR